MEPRRLSPKQFFALRLDGGTMTAAQHFTHLAYSTICDAKRGEEVSVPTAKELEKWSRGLPSAQAAGVCIGAVIAVGLAPAPTKLPRKIAARLAEAA